MKYSLFIGRWQPLHKGHIKLIRTVLDEGKYVCIAIRDTPINKENPYTIEQRVEMFREEFRGEKVILMNIPDISEICYGRKVGYEIREIRLDEKIEEISATKIREAIK